MTDAETRGGIGRVCQSAGAEWFGYTGGMELTIPARGSFSLDRPRIMGILNVTPDSFSDGGAFADVDRAAAYARRMLEEGADAIDVGGESTRPGAQRVGVREQIERVVPVIRCVRALIDEADSPAVISIDTTLAAVAEAALDAGASMVNDVSAGREDARMLQVAAERGVPIVLMHMQGEPATMLENPTYENVVAEVRDFLIERVEAAQRAGIGRGQIVIDPGIGFGKTTEHNLTLLGHLHMLVSTGYPVLLGASRKRFMAQAGEGALRARDRVGGTCATTALGVAAGVRIFRVHDVAANRQAADVAWAVGKHEPG